MKIAPPSETVFHAIESTIKDYRRFAQQNIAEVIPDMTIDQGLVLLYLNEYPEMTQKEIAELVFKDNASMTRMIHTMVNKNFIRRLMNDSDRRRYKLELTKKGRDVLNTLPAIIHENRKSSLKGISKNELEQLQGTLDKIRLNCQNH